MEAQNFAPTFPAVIPFPHSGSLMFPLSMTLRLASMDVPTKKWPMAFRLWYTPCSKPPNAGASPSTLKQARLRSYGILLAKDPRSGKPLWLQRTMSCNGRRHMVRCRSAVSQRTAIWVPGYNVTSWPHPRARDPTAWRTISIHLGCPLQALLQQDVCVPCH